MKNEEFDVVVVGSGAGGSPPALVMAQKGARVLVLEKGRRHTRDDFLHDEISMCRRDYFTPFPVDDPHTLRHGETETAQRTAAGWISQCVGGGTVHMSGFFLRFHPKDFALSRHYGALRGSTAIDWPFEYETLAPYYDRVESELGVSGDTTDNPFAPPRRGPFPYPPILTHPVSAWIDDAGRKLGLHPFPMPRAIITTPNGSRGSCVYCALCGSYGCEVDAKSSTLVSLLAAAEATKRCEVRAECMVTEIEVMRNGLARGVVYEDAQGQRHRVVARAVVVAASALESARLLLLSRSSSHPNGLGNNSGQVGRNLCFSTLGQLKGRFDYADFDAEGVEILKNPMPFVGRAIQDAYEVAPSGDVFGKGGTFHFLWAHPNPIFAAEQLIHAREHERERDPRRLIFGRPLIERMAKHFRDGRTLEVECFGEWLPTPGCYVSLDPKITDRFGLPAARITIDRHPSDRASSQVVVDRARSMLEALRCRDIEVEAVGGETLVLQHGTCRMGNDPTESVTTAAGHLHEVSNVYVTDGGSLPTSGAVPSTLTILANAFRIADHMAGAMG
ncbi:MAG: GMC family oxidoreductase [Deltaproteobacteria bacterium]|nr:GMC family oxidoreductase [Deltaproteobacteria bacterium]